MFPFICPELHTFEVSSKRTLKALLKIVGLSYQINFLEWSSTNFLHRLFAQFDFSGLLFFEVQHDRLFGLKFHIPIFEFTNLTLQTPNVSFMRNTYCLLGRSHQWNGINPTVTIFFPMWTFCLIWQAVYQSELEWLYYLLTRNINGLTLLLAFQKVHGSTSCLGSFHSRRHLSQWTSTQRVLK